MAGLAFLPWAKWIARLLHALAVAFKRRAYRVQRRWSLARSEGWPEVEGTIEAINWDSGSPREEIVYSYSTEHGYYSGSYWRWFDLSNIREVRAGEHVALRYNPREHDRSVFLKFC